MNQQAFKLFTWSVVGSTVASAVWLAAHVQVQDLRAAKALEQDTALMPLPTEPTGAGHQASAAASAPTFHQ